MTEMVDITKMTGRSGMLVALAGGDYESLQYVVWEKRGVCAD